MSLFDRAAIDEEVWDELEELLILADVGVNTTERLIEKVKRRVGEEKIGEGSLVRSALKVEMVNILEVPDPDVTAAVSPRSSG